MAATCIIPLLILLLLLLFHNSAALHHTHLQKLSRDSDDDFDDDHDRSLEEREHRLKIWAEYLYHLEKHLDAREEYLRHSFCPDPPRYTSPKLCEFCLPSTRCAKGLTCQDRRCQRVNAPNPIKCPNEESCGPGQQRSCSKIRSSDFEKPGVLKKRLVDLGFFVGKTDFIPDCVMGKVRIDCRKRREICKKEFCITMTLRECRRDGLLDGDLNGGDNDLCCVKAVPVDCFVSKLCRCIAKRLF